MRSSWSSAIQRPCVNQARFWSENENDRKSGSLKFENGDSRWQSGCRIWHNLSELSSIIRFVWSSGRGISLCSEVFNRNSAIVFENSSFLKNKSINLNSETAMFPSTVQSVEWARLILLILHFLSSKSRFVRPETWLRQCDFKTWDRKILIFYRKKTPKFKFWIIKVFGNRPKMTTGSTNPPKSCWSELDNSIGPELVRPNLVLIDLRSRIGDRQHLRVNRFLRYVILRNSQPLPVGVKTKPAQTKPNAKGVDHSPQQSALPWFRVEKPRQ